MKKLLIAILICALFPITILAAENATEQEILEKDIRIYQLEIIARQEMVKRLSQEIQVWQGELKKANDKLKELKEKKEIEDTKKSQ